MATKKKPAPTARHYWLFKSEPEAYSITDLAREPTKTTFWDGVRNYQARNFLRDTIQRGDRVLFYHSNADPMSIVGTAEVVQTGYPDHTAFDPQDHHYDPKSRPDQPTWFMVDVKLLQVFPKPVTRDELKACPALSDMMVLRRGARLSIQPVTAAEWQTVHRLAGMKDKP
ncbi:MAG: EVE domain-containing protein [Planctomycetaceae bacterium]|nr:EVE domain-containing protein [Planctomycetaceae bacterium]